MEWNIGKMCSLKNHQLKSKILEYLKISWKLPQVSKVSIEFTSVYTTKLLKYLEILYNFHNQKNRIFKIKIVVVTMCKTQMKLGRFTTLLYTLQLLIPTIYLHKNKNC